MLQDSRKSILLSEELDLFLKIDEITMDKFPQRLELFEEMSKYDEMLYKTDGKE